MTDILDKLRDESLRLTRGSFDHVECGVNANIVDEAIDEIERLRGVAQGSFEHICSDIQCRYDGKPSVMTCRCHKDKEQMMRERIAYLEARISFLESAQAEMKWRDGAPARPWSQEWFIAKTTYGDRLVLRALPDEWTYDFTTADETYIKADKIKCWMQFPDSNYISPDASTLPSTEGGSK